jgi:hypothetical protein
MPRLPIDYSNTIIYKLCCNDPTITDIYVGHTTNWTKRKQGHKTSCNSEKNKSYNFYVYTFIRDHGGWTNWNMIEIEKMCCINTHDAKKNERIHMELLKATLNKQLPTRTHNEWIDTNKEQLKERQKEYYEDNKEQIKEYQKEYREEHIEQIKETNKQYYEDNKDIIKEKQKEYYEDNKDIINEKSKQYNKEHTEQINEKSKQYREEHKDKQKEYNKKYNEKQRLKKLENKNK